MAGSLSAEDTSGQEHYTRDAPLLSQDNFCGQASGILTQAPAMTCSHLAHAQACPVSDGLGERARLAPAAGGQPWLTPSQPRPRAGTPGGSTKIINLITRL